VHLVYCSPCSTSSTKGRSASSRLPFSPDLHLGGSQRVRVPEYAAAPHLSPLLPGVIVRDNRRTSQPSSTKTRHCTPHSPSHLTTPAWLAYHHRPPTNYCFLALHRIILIQPVSACCDPHPGTLSTLIRFSQLRGNASCLSQPPILDSPTPALGHLQHLCLSHHHTRPRRQGPLLHQK